MDQKIEPFVEKVIRYRGIAGLLALTTSSDNAEAFRCFASFMFPIQRHNNRSVCPRLTELNSLPPYETIAPDLSRKMAQEKKQIFQHEQKRVTTFYQEDDEDDDPQFELEVHSLTDVSHDPKPLENKEIKKKPSTWKRIRHFLGIRKPRRWKRLKEPAPSGSSHKDHSQRCEADRPTARPQPRNRELDKLQSLTTSRRDRISDRPTSTCPALD
ncbi:hypothetical protein F2P81_020722 [Scophthalmus maximus]|uniref:Uncharacterized protein n=1 Tax=Scophthalmus maximus TaxID=52904 RepID=A0A6A4SA55_SCOMX|nr:hypothetical protein F2P81_020722 [Scophthalmus maximus]